MSFDRHISLLLKDRADAPSNDAKIPILMYHSISDTDESKISPYYRLCTSQHAFREQMQYLSNEGYQSVLPNSTETIPSGKKPVVITFDDGYQDNYIHAFPILKEFGLTAIIYLPTAYIGNDRRSFNGRSCITWSEVAEMREKGIHFGSHSVNHSTLQELTDCQLGEELTQSKEELEDHLREEITHFAFPFAFPQEDLRFRKRFEHELRKSGYRSCVTTMIGRNRPEEDTYLLKRLPVNSGDDPALFSAKLSGAYDWLGKPQSLWRRTKHLLAKTPTQNPNAKPQRKTPNAKPRR